MAVGELVAFVCDSEFFPLIGVAAIANHLFLSWLPSCFMIRRGRVGSYTRSCFSILCSNIYRVTVDALTENRRC